MVVWFLLLIDVLLIVFMVDGLVGMVLCFGAVGVMMIGGLLIIVYFDKVVFVVLCVICISVGIGLLYVVIAQWFGCMFEFWSCCCVWMMVVDLIMLLSRILRFGWVLGCLSALVCGCCIW